MSLDGFDMKITSGFNSVLSEGPCLIHSMNGDLLRTLEGPENCLRPKLIQASREGHCIIYYENGLFCLFSVNGKLQATMETDDKIRVSVMKYTLEKLQFWNCSGFLSMQMVNEIKSVEFHWLLNLEGLQKHVVEGSDIAHGIMLNFIVALPR